MAVLAFSSWLSALYALPLRLVLAIGVVNLVYASYSFSLAMWPKRSTGAIAVLAGANLTWAAVCVSLTIAFWQSGTGYGVGALLIEAVLVGGLGYLEWSWREQLVRGE